MLEKSFGLLFFLKKPNPFRKGPWLLFLRITVNGISRELSLKRTWEKSRWNSKSGRASGNKEDTRELNTYIDIIRIKAFEARSILFAKNQAITSEAIKDELSGASQRRRMFLKVFEDYNKNIKQLIGKDYTQDTYNKYDRVFNNTKSFLSYRYKVPDISLSSIDMEFINAYYQWYRVEKNCSHNTTIKYISMFKTILLACVENGWLLKDPISKFHMSIKTVDTVFLTSRLKCTPLINLWKYPWLVSGLPK
jgi:hypothetical protein